MRTCILLLIFVSLAFGQDNKVNTLKSTESISFGAYSTGQSEFSFLNMTESIDSRFYTKGKVFNFMFIHEGELLQNVSLDFVFPGVIMFAMCFTSSVEKCGNARHFSNLLNGEIGFRYSYFSIALANSLHPFIYRGLYHDSGVKINVGSKHEGSIYLYEQDRLWNGNLVFGVKLEYNYY
ncbi:MAG: hypothetical protein OCD01_04220 [Fibrobacterales bacterium]